MIPIPLPPTPYPDLNDVLDELVARVRGALGGAFVGAYLQGSFAAGDFDVHSDVDFAVVTEAEPEGESLAALRAAHAAIYDSGPEWARHLEGSYFPRETLNSAEAVNAEPLWYLDNGSRSLVRSTHCNTWVVRWVLHEHGIALAGPDARTLFDPVPADVLRAEVRDVMRDWAAELFADPARLDTRWYQPFAVISYCRMLQTLATGTVRSKTEGVRWALGALDPRWAPLIRQAWAERPDPSLKARLPADPDALRETRAFLRYALARSGLPSGR